MIGEMMETKTARQCEKKGYRLHVDMRKGKHAYDHELFSILSVSTVVDKSGGTTKGRSSGLSPTT